MTGCVRLRRAPPNIYAYVSGNPINLIDEDGLMGHAPGTAPSTGPSNPWSPLPYNPGFGPQNCGGYYAPGRVIRACWSTVPADAGPRFRVMSVQW